MVDEQLKVQADPFDILRFIDGKQVVVSDKSPELLDRLAFEIASHGNILARDKERCCIGILDKMLEQGSFTNPPRSEDQNRFAGLDQLLQSGQLPFLGIFWELVWHLFNPGICTCIFG